MRRTPTETSQVRDRAVDDAISRDPRSTSASRYGFTPTRFVARTPRCHVQTLVHLEKTIAPHDQAERVAPEGSDSILVPDTFVGISTSRPRAETREPLGPLYPVARESFRAQPHPRCLPPRSPSLPSDGCYPPSCEGGEAPLVVRPHRPHRNRFDTFLTAGATTLTKSLPEAQSV